MSASSSSTISSSSSSSSSSPSSSLHLRTARPRTLPRRGQIKAAIFAALFQSIVRFLGVHPTEERENAAHPPLIEVGSHTHTSDFRMDVDGGLSADEGSGLGISVRSSPVGSALSVGSSPAGLGLSVRSSTVSMSSGSLTPHSPLEQLSRPHSFHEGMQGKGQGGEI